MTLALQETKAWSDYLRACQYAQPEAYTAVEELSWRRLQSVLLKLHRSREKVAA